MDESEDNRIPISALQHFVYCPRQCALIHLEQVWDENIFTLRGARSHERVHEPGGACADGEREERALPLWSERLGLVGKSDLVVFLRDGTPFPVEHKSGKRRARDADDVQLAAQAMCLEEMFGRPVPRGAIYYGASKRRREVAIGDALRAHCEETVRRVRDMLSLQALPEPVADRRCHQCSLISACMPFALERLKRPRLEPA